MAGFTYATHCNVRLVACVSSVSALSVTDMGGVVTDMGGVVTDIGGVGLFFAPLGMNKRCSTEMGSNGSSN